MAKRTRPLQARSDGLTGAAAEAEAEMEVLADGVVAGPTAAPSGEHAAADRIQRLAEGVRGLRTGGTLKLGERTLMVLGGVLAPLGLVLVLVGWNGAAHTPNLFEQIPYAISGGMFGLGLVFLGAFCYFAHWMTELVKEHRVQSAAVIEAIGRLEDAVRSTATTAPAAAVAALGTANAAVGSPNGVGLVATGKGTMAHRPDCVVVAGKDDLRPVAAGDGLAPCKLCDPYAVAAN